MNIVERILADYAGDELTVAEIAEKYSLPHASTVSRLAAKHGRPRRWLTGGCWNRGAPKVAFRRAVRLPKGRMPR